MPTSSEAIVGIVARGDCPKGSIGPDLKFGLLTLKSLTLSVAPQPPPLLGRADRLQLAMAAPTYPRQDPLEINIQATGPQALGLSDEEDTLLHRVWLDWCQAVWEDISETSSSTSSFEHVADLQFVPCSRCRSPRSD